MTTFATKLRTLRMSAGLTVEALATRCAIKGLSGRTIKKYEAGERVPSDKTRRILALAIACAVMDAALKPFVAFIDKQDGIYRKRGGDPDAFPDTHPFIDIKAHELPAGVWRAARKARALGIADELNGATS